MKTIKEFDKYMNTAYKSCNFFDSLAQIKELKKNVPIKEIKKYLKEQIDLRKGNSKMLTKLYRKAEKQCVPRNYNLFEQALSYVTHDFKINNYIFIYEGQNTNNEPLISCVQIKQHLKSGYGCFKGNKLGIMVNVKFKDVIAHSSKFNEVLKFIEEKKK